MSGFPGWRVLSAFLTIAFAYTLVSGQAQSGSTGGTAAPGAAGEAAAVKDQPAPQTQLPFIKLVTPAPNVTEASFDAGKFRARFAVSLNGVKSSDITLRIIRATLDSQPRDYVDAFNPLRIEPPVEGRYQAILIEFDPTKGPNLGTYLVSLEATTGTPAKSLALPDLQIKVLSAKLRAPKTLIIQRVIPFFFFDQQTTVAPPLDLRETTGRTELMNLEISQVDLLSDKNEQIDGRIKFGDPRTIAPDQSQSIAYELTGGFPLGTAKGSLELTSRQLAEPLTVNVEVRTRRAKWIILLVIAIGLLVGNFVRIRLTQKIERDEAKLKALDLAAQFERRAGQHQDAPFREKLSDALRTLNDSIAKGTAVEITQATATANTTLTDAFTSLAERRTVAETLFRQIAELTETKWSAPPLVVKVLADASDALKAVRSELNVDDVAGAAAALNKIRSDLAGNLAEPVAAWRAESTNYLATLGVPDIPLPSAVNPRLKVALDAVNPKISAIADVNPTDQPDQIKTVLGELHVAHINVIQLAADLKASIRATVSAVVAALGDKVLDQGAIDRLREKVQGLEGTLDLGVDSPREASDNLGTELLALHDAWRQALINQLPGAVTDAQRQPVQSLIDARDYVGAARLIFAISKQTEKDAKEGVLLGPESVAVEGIGGPGVATLIEPWTVRNASAVTPAVFMQMVREGGGAVPLDTLRIRTAREIMRETSLLNVLVGLGLLVVGYLLFADKFVGTAEDLAAVFFWAFGVNVTVDALTQTAKTLKKP